MLARLRGVTDDAVELTSRSTRIGPGGYRSARRRLRYRGRRSRARDLDALATRDLRSAARARGSSSGASRSAREKRASFRDDDVLGPAGPGLRRSARPGAGRRARARRARRQPHRARVHRRPVGRLPVRVDVPVRLREPADVGRGRRRPRAARRVRRRRGPLRAAREQADAGRARRVRAVPPARARAPRPRARDRRARRVRLRSGVVGAARRRGLAASSCPRAGRGSRTCSRCRAGR